MVRLSLALIAVLLAGTAWPQTPAPRPPDGAMLSETPCQFISYAQASGFTRRHYPQDEYEAAVRSTTVECRRIRYASGGLSVVGFIVRPRGPATVRYPVIVYNRGGFRDIGMIDAWNLVDFYGFASQGFVVLASQYRGNDGGEGRDEVGGADVGDVMALPRLAASLPYADPSNLFLYGLSRGGMMSFLALKQGFPARAVAVVGAVFDVEAFRQRAPGMVESALGADAAADTALLRDRSVTNWPERLAAPLLVIHGAGDREVPATEAMTFATRLADLGKPYELVVYAGDVHEAAINRKDRDARILGWFRKHARQ